MKHAKDFRELYGAIRMGRTVYKPILYYALQHPTAYAQFVQNYESKEERELQRFIKNVLEKK